jgi:hypothetical protein
LEVDSHLSVNFTARARFRQARELPAHAVRRIRRCSKIKHDRRPERAGAPRYREPILLALLQQAKRTCRAVSMVAPLLLSSAIRAHDFQDPLCPSLSMILRRGDDDHRPPRRCRWTPATRRHERCIHLRPEYTERIGAPAGDHGVVRGGTERPEERHVGLIDRLAAEELR